MSLVDGDEEQINPDPNFSGSSSQSPFMIDFLKNPAVPAIRAALDSPQLTKASSFSRMITSFRSEVLPAHLERHFSSSSMPFQACPTVWEEPNAEHVKLVLLERSRVHRALPSPADVEAEGAEERNEDPWADRYEESGFEQSELKNAKGIQTGLI